MQNPGTFIRKPRCCGKFDVVLALYQRCTLKDDISYLLPT